MLNTSGNSANSSIPSRESKSTHENRGIAQRADAGEPWDLFSLMEKQKQIVLISETRTTNSARLAPHHSCLPQRSPVNRLSKASGTSRNTANYSHRQSENARYQNARTKTERVHRDQMLERAACDRFSLNVRGERGKKRGQLLQ